MAISDERAKGRAGTKNVKSMSATFEMQQNSWRGWSRMGADEIAREEVRR